MTWHDAMTIAEKLVDQLEGVPIQDQRKHAIDLIVEALRTVDEKAYEKGLDHGRDDYAT